jgi:YidC/Oxa1 family membrane protein insertase
MWAWFKDIIFAGVQFLQGFLGDWGLAIIGVTLVFRILLIPILNKQTKSAAAMQKLQPKMKELQAKYKDNPEKLQEEMSKFYKENKVNPLGGCLPMFLQMPIFIALFQVLRELPTRISGAGPISFLGIIPDLSVTMKTLWGEFSSAGTLASHWLELLPYAILVLLGGVSIILPQLLQKNDSASAGTMRMMSIGMGAMMLYLGWVSPAGVLLYWITSSVFGAAQQIIVQRQVYKEDDDTEDTITVEPISVKQKSKKPGKKNSK